MKGPREQGLESFQIAEHAEVPEGWHPEGSMEPKYTSPTSYPTHVLIGVLSNILYDKPLNVVFP